MISAVPEPKVNLCADAQLLSQGGTHHPEQPQPVLFTAQLLQTALGCPVTHGHHYPYLWLHKTTGRSSPNRCGSTTPKDHAGRSHSVSNIITGTTTMGNDYRNLTAYLESNGWVSLPSELATHVWTRPERMMNIPVNVSSEHPKEWAALIGQIADANGVPVESVLDQIMQPDVDRMYPSAPAGTHRADIASSIEMNLSKPLDSIDGLALAAIDWVAASTVPPSTWLTGVARHSGSEPDRKGRPTTVAREPDRMGYRTARRRHPDRTDFRCIPGVHHPV